MSSRNAPCHCRSGKKYKGVTGLGREATDLIAAGAYWICARDQFCLIFPLLPVADARAGFKVG
ncbi:MAG: SEC-C domain-containing protein, partial [Acidovorax sp.]|nr:SEC-C domain-containing protein [Acidovorax sp.]